MEALQQVLSYDSSAQISVAKVLIVAALLYYASVDS